MYFWSLWEVKSQTFFLSLLVAFFIIQNAAGYECWRCMQIIPNLLSGDDSFYALYSKILSQSQIIFPWIYFSFIYYRLSRTHIISNFFHVPSGLEVTGFKHILKLYYALCKVLCEVFHALTKCHVTRAFNAILKCLLNTRGYYESSNKPAVYCSCAILSSSLGSLDVGGLRGSIFWRPVALLLPCTRSNHVYMFCTWKTVCQLQDRRQKALGYRFINPN